MIIPISTDAPIYYWPYATVGTIIVNCAIFFATMGMSDAQYENFLGACALIYGEWNPVQWLTSNYLHADIFHLAGNMFVLWGIGIIVEGKIGPTRYVLLYNAIGFVQCGIEQTLMLPAGEGGSLGASAIIFALLAIAMVWAPMNELTCFFLIFWRGFMFDVTVMVYVFVSVAIEFIVAVFHVGAMLGDEGMITVMTSELIHLMGAVLGFGIGVVMLKRGWVDCENWDLFSVLKNRHTLSREQREEERLNSEEAKAKLVSIREGMLTQFRNYLAADEPAAALAVHRRAGLQFADWRLPEPDHVHLVGALRKWQRWDDTVAMMVEYCRLYTEREPLVRLALAQLLVDQLGRPMQALKVLSRLNPASLPAAQQATLKGLHDRAVKMSEDNPFEATIEGW